MSAAAPQLQALVSWYGRVLPPATFPWLPFSVAAVFQVLAWFGGRFLGPLSIAPRVLVLWLFALGEYAFMSPAMNAATEVLRVSEPLLIVMYQVVSLVVFLAMNTLVFGNPFRPKFVLAFALLAAAAWVAFVW